MLYYLTTKRLMRIVKNVMDNNKQYINQIKSNRNNNYSTEKKRLKLTSNLATRLAYNTLGKEKSKSKYSWQYFSFNTFSCEEFHEEPVNDKNRVTANLTWSKGTFQDRIKVLVQLLWTNLQMIKRLWIYFWNIWRRINFVLVYRFTTFINFWPYRHWHVVWHVKNTFSCNGLPFFSSYDARYHGQNIEMLTL